MPIAASARCLKVLIATQVEEVLLRVSNNSLFQIIAAARLSLRHREELNLVDIRPRVAELP